MNRLDALGAAELRDAALFVRSRQRAVTADEVADEFAIARTVARARLERLVAAGVLVTAFERRTGRSGPGAGRPAKVYAAAVETVPIEFPPRRYDALVRGLVDALPRRGRAARLAQIGATFGAELAHAARLRRARTVPNALERLCSGLGRLGFHAALDSVSGSEAVIVSATCPLRPLVFAEPQAHAIDEGMWRALVGAAVGDGRARVAACGTHECLDADAPCRIVIRFADRAQAAGR